MSSISLDRREEGGPLAISAAGAESVTLDPEFRKAVSKINQALDAVVEIHGSLEAGRGKAAWSTKFAFRLKSSYQTRHAPTNQVRQREYDEAVGTTPIISREQPPSISADRDVDTCFHNDIQDTHQHLDYNAGAQAPGDTSISFDLNLVDPILRDPLAFNEQLDAEAREAHLFDDDDSSLMAVTAITRIRIEVLINFVNQEPTTRLPRKSTALILRPMTRIVDYMVFSDEPSPRTCFLDPIANRTFFDHTGLTASILPSQELIVSCLTLKLPNYWSRSSRPRIH